VICFCFVRNDKVLVHTYIGQQKSLDSNYNLECTVTHVGLCYWEQMFFKLIIVAEIGGDSESA
jgi:hypothetical protein